LQFLRDQPWVQTECFAIAWIWKCSK
jgi:hypothetical protein